MTDIFSIRLPNFGSFGVKSRSSGDLVMAPLENVLVSHDVLCWLLVMTIRFKYVKRIQSFFCQSY